MCDVVAANLMRWTAGSPLTIPVGVLTSLIGGVFFLGMLLGRRAESPIV
jgi:ABC-type enterobactin transport system permease subunit